MVEPSVHTQTGAELGTFRLGGDVLHRRPTAAETFSLLRKNIQIDNGQSFVHKWSPVFTNTPIPKEITGGIGLLDGEWATGTLTHWRKHKSIPFVVFDGQAAARIDRFHSGRTEKEGAMLAVHHQSHFIYYSESSTRCCKSQNNGSIPEHFIPAFGIHIAPQFPLHLQKINLEASLINENDFDDEPPTLTPLPSPVLPLVFNSETRSDAEPQPGPSKRLRTE
ncbi:hypothetical protein EVAR_102131_1 [Eumeta japonica]|uniref:Uncharacterized protein n=1 Tax=Eumeta variegata TaxID=151549 RepID=A0A4C1TZR8_EUMVA|nr:hypothetical protein EVAR_102131_1 [Eumeta japonica]